MSRVVNIHAAKTQLSRLVDEAADGAEIISRDRRMRLPGAACDRPQAIAVRDLPLIMAIRLIVCWLHRRSPSSCAW
jgi:hypothetical protein